MLQPGCARRVVVVLLGLSCNWSACLGLRCGPYGPGCLCLVAVGRPYTVSFVSGVFCSGSPVLGVFSPEVVIMSRALCVAAFFGLLSSLPPNDRLVLLSAISGCGGRLGFGCFGRVWPARMNQPPKRALCAFHWCCCTRCCYWALPYGPMCCAGAPPASIAWRACSLIPRLHCGPYVALAWPAATNRCVVLLRDPPPWSAVQIRCSSRRHVQVCYVGARPAVMVGCVVSVSVPPSWMGVLCWCVTLLHGQACGAGA